MQVDMISKAVEAKTDIPSAELKTAAASSAVAAKPVAGGAEGQKEALETGQMGKEPTMATIDSVMSEANQRMTKTRCEYSYDEPTRRVSIKIFDEDSGQMIREVPPEKSLEMLQKMWELAGLMVDEKR